MHFEQECQGFALGHVDLIWERNEKSLKYDGSEHVLVCGCGHPRSPVSASQGFYPHPGSAGPTTKQETNSIKIFSPSKHHQISTSRTVSSIFFLLDAPNTTD